MYFTDEKDYIMRMIKEMVRVLFSLMFGKKYVSVELEKENKYEVSGKNLKDLKGCFDTLSISDFCFIGFHRQLDPFNSSLLTEMFF